MSAVATARTPLGKGAPHGSAAVAEAPLGRLARRTREETAR